MAKFEFVTGFKDCGLPLPERKTSGSAGYDLAAAADIIIPSYTSISNKLISEWMDDDKILSEKITLNEMAKLTKSSNTKLSLVPTGLKCKLDPGTYLELSVRSSTPLKHWIIMANGVGIIDQDYYNNQDNEGHIYIQLLNLSPFDIEIKKGDIIAQGIIKSYLTVEDDNATGERLGGFGSTSK